MHESWQPYIKQTNFGMSYFLSCLYVLCDLLNNNILLKKVII